MTGKTLGNYQSSTRSDGGGCPASRYRSTMLIAAFSILAMNAAADAPLERWCIETGLKNPAPPLVADLHAEDGLEVLAVFPEDGSVQCFDARGKSIWIHSEAAPAAPVAPAFLGELLAFATAAGEIVALVPTTGEERWRSERIGNEVLGIAVADLDDDDTREIIVTTAQSVVALDAEGLERWRFDATITGAPAIMDVNEDGYAEVYAVSERGPICLDYDGLPLWEADEDGNFAGTPVVGDADADLLYEVYALRSDPQTLIGFDADFGDIVFERSLELVGGRSDAGNEKDLLWTPVPAYAAGQLILGDIDQDAASEIIVSLPSKQTQVVGRGAGGMVWDDRRQAMAIANINRDSRAEFVGAAGKHAFAGNGLQQSGWDTDYSAPIVAAPVVCNMDGNGPAAIITAHADGSICRWQADGPYVPSLSPWPMDGANPARTHAVISPDLDEPGKNEITPVADASDLWGWTAGSDNRELTSAASEDSEVEIADAETREKLQLEAWGTPLSPALAVSPDLRGLDVTVAADQTFDGKVQLHWISNGLLSESVEMEALTAGDRALHRLTNTPVALTADAFMVTATPSEGGQFPSWQDVTLRGRVARIPTIQIFYNHVGYEIGAEKRFTVAASFRANEGSVSVINAQDKSIFTRPLEGAGETITGAYGNDWDGYYWSGEFTDFNEPGLYRLRVTVESAVAETPPFEVAPHLLWRKLIGALLVPYRDNRCGEPGADCGDDRGWYDPARGAAADPAPHAVALAEALRIAGWRMERDADGVLEAMQEELVWGADALLATIDDALATGTPESNSAAAAALASAGTALPEGTHYLDGAGKLVAHEHARDTTGLALWSAAVDLYVATEDATWKEIATALYTGPSLEAPEASVAYETHIDMETLASFHTAYQMQEAVRPILSHAQNPFGVYTQGEGQSINWFGTPEPNADTEPTGNTAAILPPAKAVAQAYRFQPVPPYQRFVLGQLNWLLGNNPLDAILIDLPQAEETSGYGTVRAGIAGRAPGDDRPVRAEATPSLTNNAKLIEVLANYKRVRLAM